MNFNPYKMFRDLFVAVNMCVDFKVLHEIVFGENTCKDGERKVSWIVETFHVIESYIQRLGVSYAKNTLKHCLKG